MPATTTARPFYYLGKRFTPLRNFSKQDGDFHKVTRNSRIFHGTPLGWNYNDFYTAAKTANAQVDLYQMDGLTVFPSLNVIFIYNHRMPTLRRAFHHGPSSAQPRQ